MVKNVEIYSNKSFKGKILRFVFACFIVTFLVYGIVALLKHLGLWQYINSVEKIKTLVERGGTFSFIIFIILQILQTTILQIPSIVVTLVGTLVFGPIPTFFMSYFAILVGSLIMFLIGRKVGRKFLYWIVGETASEKWINLLTNGKYAFFLMMLFPLFPDDILCAVAGITNMSFRFFLWTNIITRGIGIFCAVFLMSGKIIPFFGWGLFVWFALAVFVAVLFYLSVRYRQELDNIFLKKHNKQ